ncbi:hypothetical protein LCGC14_1122270 [marine sediment metagenome]|uniref:Glutaminase n=1 Tax=marine sediment metagenome TaxID=412755 RepID=A0A0F9M8D5_9ZZZZ|nr:pyridoxal 5'-phosphate synthase glutaminase subunit PdxT [Actinomycetota bacterium]
MIGILALQGAFREHQQILEVLGQRTVLVKKPSQLSAIDGLVLGGGESTTMSLLLDKYEFKEPLKDFVQDHPILATCAGLILLSKKVKDGDSYFPVVDVSVKRNAYGRQVDSFEEEIDVPLLGPKPFPGVFIRAPKIEKVGLKVDTLAVHDKRAVVVKQGGIIGLTFHPELTNDTRFHQHFVTLVNKSKAKEKEKV